MRIAGAMFTICVVLGAGGCQATKSLGWFLAEALLNGSDEKESYVDSAGARQR